MNLASPSPITTPNNPGNYETVRLFNPHLTLNTIAKFHQSPFPPTPHFASVSVHMHWSQCKRYTLKSFISRKYPEIFHVRGWSGKVCVDCINTRNPEKYNGQIGK